MPRRRNTTRDGYGSPHQKLRAIWARRVAEGTVKCARCDKFIRPNEPFDLDHADTPDAHRRGIYVGISHRHCNVAARNAAVAAKARGEGAPRAKALDFFNT
jgi:hypothetical protein